ncbi:MAG: twin-arginine translocation signal domain-containing protein [Faecalibacterium prausnitzii]
MSTKKISRRDFLKAAGISAAAIGLTAAAALPAPPSTTGSAGSAAVSAESAAFSVTADVTGDRAHVNALLVSSPTRPAAVSGQRRAAGSLGNGSDMAQMLQMGTLDVLMSDDMTMDGVLDGALGFAWLPGLVADTTRQINTTSRAGS